ncbi:MAG: rhamnogalacturonan acetylesterase, partial [Lachnospiraceae bacterium]|nr:rhamnogalacturonan acetylesterase [Lachnospiraceae bacterium]
MQTIFEYKDITYPTAATGWVDGVYYPRVPQERKGSSFLTERNGLIKITSRAWKEIEETGYGIYYYEETTVLNTTLDGSNYEVEITLANPTDEAYTCHIRFNGIVKAEAVTVESGEEKSVKLIACMTDGALGMSFVTGAMSELSDEVLMGEIYIKDIVIVPEQPKQRKEKPTVYLLSDSTVQSYEKRFYPQAGWGQVFYQFFEGAERYREYRAKHSSYSLCRTYELPKLVIENRSIGGRSAKSFYDEGKLDEVLEIICPGDYMLVQFAHNDATAIRPNRYIAPEDFPFYIQRYIDACKRRGAQVVLVTPVAMRTCGDGEEFHISFASYREQMLKLAKKQNIPLLDLGAESTRYLNQIGAEESKSIYLWLAEGEYPDGAYAAGVSDKAHLQEYGAKVYANIVSSLIQEYDRDNRLDGLKALVSPKQEIEKPKKSASGKVADRPADMVTGFVVQEISIENGKGSFLLNWNPVKNAVAYHVYAKKKEELTFEIVKAVTKEEKE